MAVHPSGYYAWCRNKLSDHAREDQRLLVQIKHSWLESGGVYGYRKIHLDLREAGEACGKHRVALLGLRSLTRAIGAAQVIAVASLRRSRSITWVASLMCRRPMLPGPPI